MDHITIPIPKGLDADRKADITGWLTDLVNQVTTVGPAIDDDPAVRAKATQRIKQGMAEIESGQGVDGREAMRRIAEKYGLTLPG